MIFKHTSTLGIREQSCNRHVLTREIRNIKTQFGEVREKISNGYEVERRKYEYEDIAEIARKNKMSLGEVKKLLEDNL